MSSSGVGSSSGGSSGIPGTRLSAVLAVDTPLAANTPTQLVQLALPQGTWLIDAQAFATQQVSGNAGQLEAEVTANGGTLFGSFVSGAWVSVTGVGQEEFSLPLGGVFVAPAGGATLTLTIQAGVGTVTARVNTPMFGSGAGAATGIFAVQLA